MVTNELLAEALRLVDLGYRVFPCVPGDKTPLTEHGFHDASTSIETIEAWWKEHPRANIGIAAEGLVVLDIDGTTNPWPVDPDRSADLAGAGAIAATPRGGRHHVFRKPAGKDWRCTSSRLAENVDIRTDGGYFVVAPSTTADGTYRWAPGLELQEPLDRLPEPPQWLVDELDRLTGEVGPHEVLVDGNRIPAGHRNSTLARLAGTMRRVGMSQAEIAAALQQANRDRCSAPLPDREVARIAASIARYAPDEVATALTEHHYEQMYAESLEEDDPIAADPGAIPDELLEVPGFIDEVKHYTLATAPYPEPVLAFAGALTLQALLAGRKVRDAMDNRTNLYVLGLANSGVGKDHARKVNTRILYEVGLADCLGASIASGEGIEDRLSSQPASLFQVDEIDGLLLRVGQAKDARHEQIVSMLLQMYSSASGVYAMRARANRERMVIDQPCLCLFGTAVPRHFYESLSTRLTTNGFLARLIIMECRKRGTGRDETQAPIPASILEAAGWWAQFQPGQDPGNLNASFPIPYLVPQTEVARRRLRELRERAEAEYARAEVANDPAAMAIWARSYEKTRRLALIYACSADRREPVIGLEATEWAGAFIEHQTRRMLYMTQAHASEGEFDTRRRRLLDLLEGWRRQHGDDWMPFWRINRKLPWSLRDHEELRETLLQQRLIEFQVTSTRGRPGAVYRAATSPESVS